MPSTKDNVQLAIDEEEFKPLSMSDLARNYCKAQDLGLALSEEPILDIIEFCEDPAWGNLKLYPAQTLFFKIAYKLWDKYGFSEEEEELIKLEFDKWHIDLLMRCHDEPINHYMWIVGRRGLKSSTISFIMAYEAYRLILLKDPQKYYGIVEEESIYITNCASSDDQAKTIYNMAKARINSIPFFDKYLDPSLDSSSELALFTLHDLETIDRIKRDNVKIPRGQAWRKKNIAHGSVRLKSIPTSASTARSRGSIVNIFDEFAHFPRAAAGSGDPREAAALNNRSDVSLYRALEPAAGTFGEDFKIFIISSPLDKTGYCYVLNQQWIIDPGYLVFQFATWEVNPKMPRDSKIIDKAFRSDPLGARMEWGGEFVASSNPVLSQELIQRLPNINRMYTIAPVYNSYYIITLDPAKGSDPDSDTYAVGWGHYEVVGSDVKYIVDGLKGFRPIIVMDEVTGTPMKCVLPPEEVDDFIISLANSLKHIVAVLFDQYESTRAIASYQKLRLPAVETTFTSAYKKEMYDNFVENVNAGLVEMYGAPNLNNDGLWELGMVQTELEFLQRVVSGNTVSYRHPSSGPVTTDDFADVTANLVHHLVKLYQLGPSNYLKQTMSKSPFPVQGMKMSTPVAGSSLHPVPGGLYQRSKNLNDLSSRIRGGR